jgi:hypothetical protein
MIYSAAILAVLSFGERSAKADLIVNGGFENVTNNDTGQGLMPSNWVIANSSPDTYSNDGSYGLPPFPDFAGITAFDGIRWVAGWSAVPEEFGQSLASPWWMAKATLHLHI